MNIAPQSGRQNDEHSGKSTKIDEIIVQKL